MIWIKKVDFDKMDQKRTDIIKVDLLFDLFHQNLRFLVITLYHQKGDEQVFL